MTLTYSDYLKIDELTDLQHPLSEGEHDEMLFIVIHQVYELWFKQILHEFGLLQKSFETNDGPQAKKCLNRVLKILKVMVSQVDVLETMTPLDFLSFRERLASSSGFQSHQFREFEIRLGKRNAKMLENYKPNTKERKRLEEALTEPTLMDSFLVYLEKNGYDIPKTAFYSQDQVEPKSHEELQGVLLKVYREDPETSQLCERLVDLDEGIQEWRYRHVKMVERTIGSRIGTGGSPGVQYLASTLFKPAFPNLWEVRNQF